MSSFLDLDTLLRQARETVAKKQRKTAAVKQDAALRRAEVSSLEWNLDDTTKWQVFEVRHLFELQVCDCCGGESMNFAQELTGFRQLRAPFANRWRSGRGDGLRPDLRPVCDIYERQVPQCWDCHTLDRALEDLFHTKAQR